MMPWTETKEEAGVLDDVMVIEGSETGHPEVEIPPVESTVPENVEAVVARGDPVPVDTVATER